MKVTLLHDHPDFVVVYKPVGVTMHDEATGIVPLSSSLVNGEKLWLCHRLDDGTSGCLILAKHAEAAEVFRQLFSRREIQKFYLALTSGKPAKKQGTIAGDMKNRRAGVRILLKSRDNPAVTQFFSHSVMPGIRAAIVRPLTGQTHQIRVAMKSLGSPIVGDALYGGSDADRMYLHAFSLQFIYQDEPVHITCPPAEGSIFLQDEFTRWVSAMPSPETLNWPAFRLPEREI